jgi:TolA-binding protein
MSQPVEELASEALAAALERAGHRPAACAALMRLAGQALARLTSHDDACRLHAQLARRHAEKSARGRP